MVSLVSEVLQSIHIDTNIIISIGRVGWMTGYINQEQSCRCERLSLEGGVGETAVNDPSTMALLESATMGHFGAKVLHAASTLPPCLTQTADPQLNWDKATLGKLGQVNVVNAACAVSASNGRNPLGSMDGNKRSYIVNPFSPEET